MSIWVVVAERRCWIVVGIDGGNDELVVGIVDWVRQYTW
jgi:hypothetical protein